MITCNDIAMAIEALAPRCLAEDWDNVGLLVGRADKPVSRVLIALDMDEHIAHEAVEVGADMVLTHHPSMFHAVQRMTEDDPQQRAIRTLIRQDICHYAAHTNLDVAFGGLNDFLAQTLGLTDTQVLEITSSDGQGYGRWCDLPAEITLRELMERCKQALGLDAVRYVGDPDRTVRRVAVNSGGGAGSIGCCYDKGVECFITGDVKYNTAREAYERGLCVIDAGHYDTEIIVQEFFRTFLAERFPSLETVLSERNVRVLKTYW